MQTGGAGPCGPYKRRQRSSGGLTFAGDGAKLVGAAGGWVSRSFISEVCSCSCTLPTTSS